MKPKDVLKGKWILETKDKYKPFIQFSEGRIYTTLNSDGKDTINGKWSFDETTSTLTISSFKLKKVEVDSITYSKGENGEEIAYYSKGEELSALTNAGLKQKNEVYIYKVKVNKKQLILLSNEEKYAFNEYMASEKTTLTFSWESIFRGMLGMAFLIIISWLFSSNRSRIDWPLVGKGVALQLIIAILVLKVPAVEYVFNGISELFVRIIGFTDDGVNFLFGQFGIGVVQAPLLTFAFKVLPTIIFFSALVSLFYYWGILQKVVYVFAWLMKKFMRLSGAESLAAAGNVFLGQTEAPLLVKPYLLGMTKSEIMCLMTGGMATIAGGVLAAYVNFLGGDDPAQQMFFAKHLLTASIISAPAAIVAAKILLPETEEINEKLTISKEKLGTNALEAISNGTTDGLKLAVNVGAMLIVFISLMALANFLLNLLGGVTGLNTIIAQGGVYSGLSFEFILGYAGRPIVWLMGVDWADSIYVGELLGTKTVLNEFVAYPRLGEMKNAGLLSEKSVVMSTYMLCGFANFASIGIQIGGIGSLIPTRKGLLSQLGIRALIGGTVACLMTAVIVGMLM